MNHGSNDVLGLELIRVDVEGGVVGGGFAEHRDVSDPSVVLGDAGHAWGHDRCGGRADPRLAGARAADRPGGIVTGKRTKRTGPSPMGHAR